MADEDKRRFEELYDRYFQPVLTYALARVKPEQAKDVVAETFLIAWRRLGDVPEDPAPWLFGVARKVIAGQLRADSRLGALRSRLAGFSRGRQMLADPADEAASRNSALAAFSRLGSSDREVLMMAGWDGFPPELAAQVLGISKVSYAARLHRARRRLAAELEAEDSRQPLPPGPVVVQQTGEAR